MNIEKKFRCIECGSEDIEFDALMEWNVVEQKFELLSILDTRTCQDCGSESVESYISSIENNDMVSETNLN